MPFKESAAKAGPKQLVDLTFKSGRGDSRPRLGRLLSETSVAEANNCQSIKHDVPYGQH